ncbi:class I SAM-dependent methyltransferase [Mesorhizobium sp. ESP6-5]|uniref:class I SAM-dependent methyltransferase n=1 Tax=unclassified Mesorhizobium TaxID=325217 RepID=UPI00114F60B0|nr:MULTISPECIES: class I SAM-dependent methyltransferase [unclassified Mesorhizobium]MBZ9684553.1 class I SAM-dependent methyltransferase [Mesorhizobium sp. CO1-1-2]MBZ9698767.1 class I SAM-dependent methyltransferase [Mesorhizobium sp. CO1-1-9]MBZ9727843.1 class I SAM-dependent methyltransferase [Mesorhizobium sp. CO1-1-11]MBZ9757050.1 class I SAM-dependent methyltransferase [Mesorhizobium sp. ESP6-5]MBZ9923784.1 class I SAM-dependent methyltransferase [Mesorhizobium sp. BR1-1-4]
MIRKAPLGQFLSRNPFPNALTDGLFYREKMRAIHRVAPAAIDGPGRILEIGGGRSGMASILYPNAEVVNLDLDPELGNHQPDWAKSTFVCGDACDLPFANDSFDVATLFDVLEHIEDDRSAAQEALRVVRPGGYVLVSTPHAEWHYPYFRVMKPYCPHESELMQEWGHVRRGYWDPELAALFDRAPERRATFINPVTALFHDVAFSRLGRRRRKILYALAAPITAVGYVLHHRSTRGTETAFSWRK